MSEELFKMLDKLLATNDEVSVQKDITLAQVKVPYYIKCYGTSIAILNDNTYLQEARDNLFGEIFVIDHEKDLAENFISCAAIFFKIQNDYIASLEKLNKELNKCHMQEENKEELYYE